METINTQVLIVGAGPAGLMVACQLERHGIDFIIIDHKQDSVRSSGALVIHAASMELFEQIGLANKILECATIIHTIEMQFNNRKSLIFTMHGAFNKISRYPPLLLHEQYKTEQLLRAALNGKGINIVNSRFHEFNNNNNGTDKQCAECLVTDTEGNAYLIKSRFVVGADGHNSNVRSSYGFKTAVQTNTNPLFIMDFIPPGCHAYKPGTLSFFFNSQSAFGIFALNNGNVRIDGSVKTYRKERLLLKNITSQLPDKSIGQWQNTWFSAFKVKHLLARTFNRENVFIVGDAAHVHSPVGGQGMNSALQDAVNLAWKLAFHIKGYASAEILDTYTTERRPVNKRILFVSRLFYKGVTGHNRLLRLLRSVIVPLFLPAIRQLFKNKNCNVYILEKVSQLWIKYTGYLIQNSQFLNNRSNFKRFRPGKLMRSDMIPHNLRKTALYKLIIIKQGTTEIDTTLLNELPVVADFMDADDSLMILLRPDNYIALVEKGFDLNVVIGYFKDRKITMKNHVQITA